MNTQPYNIQEQQASLSLGQAMALQTFSLLCHLLERSPAMELRSLADLVRQEAVKRSPVSKAAAVDAAYDRVVSDLIVNLTREQLMTQQATEEAASELS